MKKEQSNGMIDKSRGEVYRRKRRKKHTKRRSRRNRPHRTIAISKRRRDGQFSFVSNAHVEQSFVPAIFPRGKKADMLALNFAQLICSAMFSSGSETFWAETSISRCGEKRLKTVKIEKKNEKESSASYLFPRLHHSKQLFLNIKNQKPFSHPPGKSKKRKREKKRNEI